MAEEPKRRGFTVVELIVVVIVIGILASITLVSYGSAQERSRSLRTIAQASAYREALKLWALKEGRPTTDSCIAPSSAIAGGVCPSAGGWGSNEPYDVAFNQKLNTYAGISVTQLGDYGSDSPKGLMYYHSNYWADNRGILYYTIGPTSDCKLPNVLTPSPDYANLVLMGDPYTARDTNRTQCIIEIFKY